MPSLRLTAPGHPPTVYHLYKKITSIGSGPDNDIVLPDPLVVDGFASPLRRPDVHGVRAEEGRVRRQRQEAQQAQADARGRS